MAEYIVHEIERQIKYDRKRFKFTMTNHLADKSPKGTELACSAIADWIMDNLEADSWLNSPLWMISGGYRFVPIPLGHPLHLLLDSESQSNRFPNWLIFRGHPKSDDLIKVTHFGPFGSKQNKKFKDDLDKTQRKLEKIIHLLGLRRHPVTKEEKSEALRQLQVHLDGEFMALKMKKTVELEALKAELSRIARLLFGNTAEDILTAIGVMSTKVLLRQLTLEVTRLVAKEIAAITSKQVAKSAGKKIPVAGAFIGAGFGLWRVFKGDFSGAVLEVVSGAASIIPGVGTVASLGVDGILVTKDIAEAIVDLGHREHLFEQIGNQINKVFDELKRMESLYEIVERPFKDPDFDPLSEEGCQIFSAFNELFGTSTPPPRST
eukprot:maker-scaffold965_size75845-snap-gene-0.10 protein:Tk03765 transcript:maker-scaffold965_size75845-snap-gene-0.10-mRNA-1 annotation:"hypothetical protein S-MbCM7_008"